MARLVRLRLLERPLQICLNVHPPNAKEGIEEALIQTSKGNKIETGNDNVDSEVQLFIDRLVQKKIDFVRNRGVAAIGPLMGTVMSEFRGKMDGAKINALLIERIEKEI